MSDPSVVRPRLDVVLPVHNEARSIAFVVEEIFDRIGHRFDARIVASEDGSSDGTQQVLEELAKHYPVSIHSQLERRGYSGAMIAGLRGTESEWILAMDGDGQCDPADIEALWNARAGKQIVIGYRNPRRDGPARRIASRVYAMVYGAALGIRLRDPSCPIVLLNRNAILPLLDALGGSPYTWWWEFMAAAFRSDLAIAEVPVTHRARRAGHTQVFHLWDMPRLALTHLGALKEMWLAKKRMGSGS